MKKFEELIEKRDLEIKSEINIHNKKISVLKSEIEEIRSEINKNWTVFCQGAVFWGIGLAVGIGIGNANGGLEALLVLICAAVIYIGGPALLILFIGSIFKNVSGSSKISSLKLEIKKKEDEIKKIRSEN